VKQAIIVDLDSTIWDINDLCIPAAAKLYPEIGAYSRDELTHWYALRDKYGPNFFDIYIEGLKPEKIPEREMFEGVGDALLELNKDMDFLIHFITHNEAIPSEMEIYLEKWIHDSIPDLNFYMTVLNHQGSKIDFARRLTIYELFGIIDDKPATLEESVEKEVPFIATIETTYNKETRVKHPQIHSFNHWKQLPDIVREASGKVSYQNLVYN
jgi:hypothetical protein